MGVRVDASLFDGCGSVVSPIQVGDKWTTRIVALLRAGPLRFSQVRAALGSVTAKVLTETLRAMEHDGFLRRTDYGGVPRRVEYELTDLGRSLLGPIDVACDWYRANAHRLAQSRTR